VSDENKHKDYSAADIEKYHRGLLSPKEMNDLEKAALDDPFLADAIEGYTDRAVHMSSDLAQLKKRLEEKVDRAKVVSMAAPKNSFKWWRVAAAVIVLSGIGFLAFWISKNSKSKSSFAKVEEKRRGDSTRMSVINPPVTDSNKFLNNETEKATTSNQPVTPTEKHSKNKAVDTAFDKNNREEVSTTESSRVVSLGYKKEIPDSSKMLKSAIANSTPSAAAIEDRALASGVSAPRKKVMSLNNQQHVNYFRGRVTDLSNNPLPFANVTSTRYSVGTYADAQGNFTLISGDSLLDVQVRSVGFENAYVQLKNNVPTNKIILNDDKAIADKVISYQKRDTSRARGSFKFEEPEPADGWSNYDTYLVNNINVPDDLKLKPNKGQVELSFDVTQEGDPVNFRIEKSLCQKCDEEAIRLIKEGPKWKKKNKKAKRVTVTVPFNAQH
jgi:hypothetical protein